MKNTKGFIVKFYGDETVGLYSSDWEITGDFNFESEEDFNEFVNKLQDAWELVCGERVKVYTVEELQMMEDSFHRPYQYVQKQIKSFDIFLRTNIEYHRASNDSKHKYEKFIRSEVSLKNVFDLFSFTQNKKSFDVFFQGEPFPDFDSRSIVVKINYYSDDNDEITLLPRRLSIHGENELKNAFARYDIY